MRLRALFHPLSVGLRKGLAGPHPHLEAAQNFPTYRYGPDAPDLSAEQARWRKVLRRERAAFART